MTALMVAAEERKKDIVQLLVQNNADVNLKGYYGYTALIYAAKRGQKDIAKILLDNNADVNATNKANIVKIEMRLFQHTIDNNKRFIHPNHYFNLHVYLFF